MYIPVASLLIYLRGTVSNTDADGVERMLSHDNKKGKFVKGEDG